MTVEEIEIVVTAKVEEALRQFKKIVPQIKEQMSNVQKEVEKVDFKGLAKQIKDSGVDKEISKVKQKVKEMFDPNDVSGLKISGIKQQISGISKEFDNLRGSNKQLGDAYDLLRYKQKIEEVKPAVQSAMNEVKKLGYVKYDTGAIQNYIDSYSKAKDTSKGSVKSTTPKTQSKNIQMKVNTNEVKNAQTELDKLDSKKKKVESGSGKSSMFSTIFNTLKKITPQLSNISNLTVKIKNTIKSWSGGIRQGIGHVLRYATALFGLQSIYSTLSSCASSWLSSQNAGAQQLSANIEYMKYAMRKCISSSNTVCY